MKYFGRIAVSLIVVVVIAAWHVSYFFINQHAAYTFLIQSGFLKYDFIYTPLIMPFFWWLGKKYDEAKFYAERDPLTMLYNRRFIFNVFPELLATADKNDQTLNIFVVDIDDFKQLNDTYGHELGDAVIQDVSDSLLRNTRRSDLVARWGGDEFLVIMLRSRHESHFSFMANIDKTLKASSDRFGVSISVSLGNSTYPESATVPNDLIRVADERMYELKLDKKSRRESTASI